MWRCVLRCCSRSDPIGAASGPTTAYYPRFRPRRLVMPIDTNDIHSPARQNNPMLQRHFAQVRLRRQVQRRGALTLATVPAERSVADAFRIMLETCERSKMLDTERPPLPGHAAALHACVVAARDAKKKASTLSCSTHDGASDDLPPLTSPFYALALDPAREMTAEATQRNLHGLSVRDVDRVWRLLERTPLNSPVHGMLAQRGKALVEATVARLAYASYPRLRSRHLQRLLHGSCGLLPCAEVARRIGFADVTGVQEEIGMWRELNVLTQRLREGQVKAAAHLQRIEQGVAQQRRWYWRAVLHSAQSRLKLFPVEMEDLEPRLEWIRSSVFAFVAFLEMAEGGRRAEALVRHLFCPQMARAAALQALLREAEELLAGSETPQQDGAEDARQSDAQDRRATLSSAMAALATELQAVRRRTSDEEAVADGELHPLNHRAALRRAAEQSSGGPHAIQALSDDLFSDYRAVRHRRQAPANVVDALHTQNAFKEAQIILKYAPHVSSALRAAPLDVDQVVRKVVEVHETNNYAPLHDAQQYRQVEYTVCRLYSGTRCLGEGKGETLIESMQEASEHMVMNYYLHGNESSSSSGGGGGGVDENDAETAKTKERGEADVAATQSVRMHEPRAEEEIAF